MFFFLSFCLFVLIFSLILVHISIRINFSSFVSKSAFSFMSLFVYFLYCSHPSRPVCISLCIFYNLMSVSYFMSIKLCSYFNEYIRTSFCISFIQFISFSVQSYFILHSFSIYFHLSV